MFTSKDVTIISIKDVMAIDVITRKQRAHLLNHNNAHNNNGGATFYGRIFVNGRKNLWRISNF